MTYIDNLEKESTTIYLTDNLNKKDRLMTFALYHSFYNYIAYSLEDSILANNVHRILKESLTEYCNNIQNEEESNPKKFIIGYLYLLKNTMLDDYSYCFLAELDSIIEELKWVNDIDKKILSFDTKTKIVMILNNIITNTNYSLEGMVGEPKVENIKKQYKKRIINYTKNEEIENYSLDDFITSLKVLTKDFVKDKIKNNEISINTFVDEELIDLYDYFTKDEQTVLTFTLIHIVSDIPVEVLSQEKLLKELSEDLGKSKIKTKITIYKFMKKWAKYINKINQEAINDASSCNNYKTLERIIEKTENQ